MKAISLCVLVLAVATLAAAVEPARACSCIPPDPWTFLRQADGAFVGRLVSRREADQGRAVLTFSVERALKGNIGDTVEVTTANNGAACGIETSVGQRIGLFLDRNGSRWFGHLCWQVSPEDLLAAASLPAPNGRGPVALFVGGRFGPARTLALDAKGRTLAYGMGSGGAVNFSVCPGSQHLAEVVNVGGLYTIVIRTLPLLWQVRTQQLKLPSVGSLRCTSASGEQLVVFAGSGPDLDRRARLVRVTPRNTTTIWQGTSWHSSFSNRVAYVTDLDDGLLAVDLRKGSVKRLAGMPREAYALVPNSDGTLFASLAYTEGVGRPRLVVVDTQRRPASVRRVPLPNATGKVVWLADGRLAVLQNPAAVVFDRGLRVVSRFGWPADAGAVVGSSAFGVRWRGRLVQAKLPSGPARVVRQLPGRPDVIVSARS